MPANRTSHQPPEMTSLDARIAKAGGTTSTVDLMSSRLHRVAGDHDYEDRTKPMSQEDLVREVGKLRQELVLHKESRNALMLFHHQASLAFTLLHSAFRDLSAKVNKSEGDLLEHWGIILGDTGEDDITRL